MFSIYRTQEGQAPLREAWLAGDRQFRDAVLQASRLIDRQLCQDPQQQGEARDEQTRILLQAPLGVLFQVDQQRQLVRILRSWAFRTVRDRDGRRG